MDYCNSLFTFLNSLSQLQLQLVTKNVSPGAYDHFNPLPWALFLAVSVFHIYAESWPCYSNSLFALPFYAKYTQLYMQLWPTDPSGLANLSSCISDCNFCMPHIFLKFKTDKSEVRSPKSALLALILAFKKMMQDAQNQGDDTWCQTLFPWSSQKM